MKHFYLNKTRTAESFRLPEEYLSSLTRFESSIRRQMGDDLLLLVLTGSGGREDILPKWSDLDILLVFKKINPSTIRVLNEEIRSERIKIGTTIYSKTEFENGIVDSKTIVNMELLRNGRFLPIVCREDLALPYFGTIFRRRLDKTILPDLLHELKRSLYDPQKLDIHFIVKTIDTIMKILLRMNKKTIVSGYSKVHSEFFKRFRGCPEIYNVYDILKGIDTSKYYAQCWEFIDYITTEKKLNSYFRIT